MSGSVGILVLLCSSVGAILIALLLPLWSQPRQRTNQPRDKPKSLTYRVSNIPQQVTEERLRSILQDASDAQAGYVQRLSYTTAAATSVATRYNVATVTFSQSLDLERLEAVLRSRIGVSGDRIKIDQEFYGLTPLADPEGAKTDVIAVTGLAGHAFGSWVAKGQPEMWLRDFLPHSAPSARILTYGYDTKLPGSHSEASISDLARNLLEAIKTVRDDKSKNRSLILIGHSLGGIVIKQALVEAAQGDPDDKVIHMASYALVFFGVPNRGLKQESLMSMVHGQPNENLVRDLGEASRYLSSLDVEFRRHFVFEDSKIVAVSETLTTPTVKWSQSSGSWQRSGPRILMVPHTSAIHGGINEAPHDRISINADHSGIVKFSHESQHEYLVIQNRLVNLVKDAPVVIGARFALRERGMSARQQAFLQSSHLSTSDIDEIISSLVRVAAPQTLEWTSENARLRDWHRRKDSAILWIKGSAGQGKTVLSRYLVDQIREGIGSVGHSVGLIYFFFYAQNEAVSTKDTALRVFVKQALSLPRVFHAVTRSLEVEDQVKSEEGQWKILEEVFRSNALDRVYCVIDALDECRDTAAVRAFIQRIKMIVQPPSDKDKSSTSLKVLVTSRPRPDISRELEPPKSKSALLSLHLEASPESVRNFIQHEVEALGFEEYFEREVIKLLNERAEQTFLWVSIILREVEQSSNLLSLGRIRQIIQRSPGDLTELYTSILDGILQRGDTETIKLLVWVTYAQRSLTLHELNHALAIQDGSTSIASIQDYMIDLNPRKIITTAGAILKVNNSRVELVHQSVKDFLVKSDRLRDTEISGGLHPNTSLAKACLLYLCFTDFASGPCGDITALRERKKQYSLLDYAARYWHHHIHDEHDFKMISSSVAGLFTPLSPRLLAWAEVADVKDLEHAASLSDIVLRTNIPCLDNLSTTNTIISKETVRAALGSEGGHESLRRQIKRPNVEIAVDGILAIIKYFDRDMVRALLEAIGETIITTEMIVAAMRNVRNAEHVVPLLLQQEHIHVQFTKKTCRSLFECNHQLLEILCKNSKVVFEQETVSSLMKQCEPELIRAFMESHPTVPIIPDAVVAAAFGPRRREGQMMQILFELRSEEISITPDVMIAAAKNRTHRVMQLLLEQRGDEIEITPDVVITAAEYGSHRVMQLLLEQRGEGISITPEVVIAAAKNMTDQVMQLLLKQRGDEITITSDVVAAATDYRTDQVMRLLLEQRGDEITITSDVVIAAAEYGTDRFVQVLLEQRGNEILISSEVLVAAASNYLYGAHIIQLLLEQRGREIFITPDVVITAARYGACRVMQVLLDLRGGEITITPDVMIAAANNRTGRMAQLLFEQRSDEISFTPSVMVAVAKHKSDELMQLLLEQRGDEIPITPEVLIAAATNSSCGWYMLQLLLKQRGRKISITREVLITVAEYGNDLIMRLLLEHPGDAISITPDVVVAAASNEGYGKEMIRLLLEQRRDEISITHDVVVAAVSNRDSGKEIIQVLLEQRCDEVIVTPRIVAAAADNRLSVDIMQLLLEQRGDEISTTPGVVIAIAENMTSEVMELLLKQRGDKISITPGVVIAIAKNMTSEVMDLLLEQRGDRLSITSNVIVAAASNFWHGSDMTQLLLELRGNEVSITPDVVVAAAENYWSGKETIELLLRQHGDQISLTPDVLVAATGNRSSVEMFRFLFHQWGNEISVTPEMLMAAVEKHSDGVDMMKFLLQQRGNEISITPEILIAAAGKCSDGVEMMEILLQQQGDQNSVTPEVLIAAARNNIHGDAMMRLLFQERGDEFTITPDVVSAAANNETCGLRLIRLLLKERGNEIQITPGIMAGAANSKRGVKIVEFLLKQRGEEITITPDVIVAAASNEICGLGLIALLFDRRNAEITITPDITIAAAGNTRWACHLLALLLEQRGDKVTITPEVTAAVAGNKRWGILMLAYLIVQRGDEIELTPDLIAIAAHDRFDRQKVMRFLLDARRLRDEQFTTSRSSSSGSTRDEQFARSRSTSRSSRSGSR